MTDDEKKLLPTALKLAEEIKKALPSIRSRRALKSLIPALTQFEKVVSTLKKESQ